jgi:trk system potassium uptake protein TrkA
MRVKKQVMIIGLGQFGLALGRSLMDRGVEVLGIDGKKERTDAAEPYLTEVAEFDATNEVALASFAPGQRDACVVAIGDNSKESSIVCTALLKQLSARQVIARANTDVHERILRLVGADQVVNPQREFGESFASRVLHREIKGVLPLSEDQMLMELQAPEYMNNKTLRELNLQGRFGVTVVAIRRPGKARVELAKPEFAVQQGDVLLLVAHEDDLQRCVEGS